MKTRNLTLSAFLICLVILSIKAQLPSQFYPGAKLDGGKLPRTNAMQENNYHDCTAILLNGKILVNEYSPRGFCKLEPKAKGTISVATVSLDDDGARPTNKKIGFRVAIRNERTNTLWMYSPEVLFEVDLKGILNRCEFNDKIIIMTVDQQYSLPHHEIEVYDGC